MKGLEGVTKEEEEGGNAKEIDVGGDVFEGLRVFLKLGETPSPVPVERIAQRNYDRFKTSHAAEHHKKDDKKDEL